MAADDAISITALAISVAALLFPFTFSLISITQTFAGTAEGLRRVQRSVLGSWSERKKKIRHWRRLRYEIQYESPHFIMVGEGYDPPNDKTQESMKPAAEDIKNADSDQLVCWIPLLAELNNLNYKYEEERIRTSLKQRKSLEKETSKEAESTASYIGMTIKIWSWDLMP